MTVSVYLNIPRKNPFVSVYDHAGIYFDVSSGQPFVQVVQLFLTLLVRLPWDSYKYPNTDVFIRACKF